MNRRITYKAFCCCLTCRLEPLPTELKYVSLANRYKCVVRGCNWTRGNLGQFKAHFMSKHASVSIGVCPHCQETFKKDNNVDFFGLILNHAFLHGNIVNQCGICDTIFANDFNVIKHILTKHGSEPCQYRRDIRCVDRIE